MFKKPRENVLRPVYDKVHKAMQYRYIENCNRLPEPDYTMAGTLYDSNCIQFWSPITNEMVPGIMPIYYISSQGNVYNKRRHTLLPTAQEIKRNELGPYKVALGRSGGEVGITEHLDILVMKAFRPLYRGHMHDPKINVSYIDPDYNNLTPSNLVWTDQRYRDKCEAIKKNRSKAMEDHYMTQLNKHEGERIQALYKGGMNPVYIHDLMLDCYPGIRYDTVYQCCMDLNSDDNKVIYG